VPVSEKNMLTRHRTCRSFCPTASASPLDAVLGQYSSHQPFPDWTFACSAGIQITSRIFEK
jgi:hypothetical protein